MNEKNKTVNALVNLMVCPRHPGSGCCTHCNYRSSGCYEQLISDSMKVLNRHFCTGNVGYDVKGTNEVTLEGSDMQLTRMLLEIGIPAHVLGYGYTKRAILMSINNDKYIQQITGMLYPTIAKEFGTTPSRVERAIRHAIEIAWNRGDIDVLYKYFGNTVDSYKGKPTNSEFIATLVEYVRMLNGVEVSK